MVRKLAAALLICLLTAGAALLLFSPWMDIKTVSVSGNTAISTEEILKRAQAGENVNLLLYNTADAEDRIRQNLYIDSVSFQKSYPDTLSIQIVERHLSGYVEYMEGKYLFIDESGHVMEISAVLPKPLPVVKGLRYDRVQLGEMLDVEDRTVFQTLVRYARLLTQYEMIEQVSYLDVSDGANTRIFYNQLEFSVGDGRDADEKVRTMKEISASLPEIPNFRGYVDMTKVRDQYVCRIIY